MRGSNKRSGHDGTVQGQDPTKVEASPMILERLTAWTLVIVYYTVTCGAILLGLKGAL
jgi:hypothetical protein